MPMPPDSRKVMAAVALVAVLVGAGYVINSIDERRDNYRHAAAVTAGDPQRGQALFASYGCGGCHSIKGVRRANGMVGPPLDGIALRAILAGRVSNTPENMQRWIRNPQAIAPGTAMPDLDVGARDARDLSAFLYTRSK